MGGIEEPGQHAGSLPAAWQQRVLVLTAPEIYARVLGRDVLWLLAVADDVDGFRRRGLMAHFKGSVMGAALLVTRPRLLAASVPGSKPGHRLDLRVFLQ